MIKPPTAPKPLSKIKNNVAKEYEAKESSDNRVLRKKNS